MNNPNEHSLERAGSQEWVACAHDTSAGDGPRIQGLQAWAADGDPLGVPLPTLRDAAEIVARYHRESPTPDVEDEVIRQRLTQRGRNGA